MHHLTGRRQFLYATAATMLASSSLRGDTSATRPIRDQALELIDTMSTYLWNSQREEGHWSSPQYGVLRSGQALTPFVLGALVNADRSCSRSKQIDSAVDWIIRHQQDGCLGIADPDVLEYPVYSTAAALRAFCLLAQYRGDDGEHTEVIDSMRRYLVQQQFNEPRGFEPDDLAFGGWGFGGKHPPGQTGHMDLAHTRWALQALTASGADAERYAPSAQRFLRLLQKHPDEERTQPLGDGQSAAGQRFDGGFYFSPIVLRANKGRIERDGETACFRSYATATCDGVLALIAAGVAASDERVTAARNWLESNPDWEYPAGIPRQYPEPWGDAVFYYHQAVRGEAYAALRVAGDWPERLVLRLRAHLRDDGSVVNRRSSLMKEDDPIMSTTLALMAVTEAYHHEDPSAP